MNTTKADSTKRSYKIEVLKDGKLDFQNEKFMHLNEANKTLRLDVFETLLEQNSIDQINLRFTKNNSTYDFVYTITD